MSGMLASVRNLEETRLVLDAGVDIIDLKEPDNGALGALDPAVIEKIVTHVNGLTTISATIGDLPYAASVIGPRIMRMADSGVDIIKVGVFGEISSPAELQLLSTLTQQGVRIVLVIFAEQYKQNCKLENVARTGITGVMLDTMDKNSGSLRDKLSTPILHDFVSQTRKYGLLSGLAGSVSPVDIEPLLAINPDYLGFRGGLCRHGERGAEMDKQAINEIRDRIPILSTKIMGIRAIIPD